MFWHRSLRQCLFVSSCLSHIFSCRSNTRRHRHRASLCPRTPQEMLVEAGFGGFEVVWLLANTGNERTLFAVKGAA